MQTSQPTLSALPVLPPTQPAPRAVGRNSAVVLRLGLLTLAWMLIECGVSAYAAYTAHSPAMLAFGSDSLVELLSALLVLSPWIPGLRMGERTATRLAAILLFVLAALVGALAMASLALRQRPLASRSGMGITAAALIAMPLLATLKRREARRQGNAVLEADAAQSATCAYLALTTLLGLAANALFGIRWLDGVAALIAVPLLLKEGRSAWQGKTCGCC